jgi:hypothetical protein
MTETTYMDVEETADLLRRPVGTLRQWRVRRFGPPARLIGGRLLYKRADVVDWIESQPTDPQSPRAAAS